MSIRLATRTAAGLVVACAAALVPTLPAVAAPADAGRDTQISTGAEQHCAIGLDAVEAADRADAGAAEPVCFATLEEVDRYLAEQTADDGSRLTATAAAASIAVGRVYKDVNKGGSSLTFWGSSGCAGVTFGFPTLSSSWSTSISSATGLNGCWATLYTSTYYGGSRMNCTAYCSGLSIYNDKIKSIVFRPTGTLG